MTRVVLGSSSPGRLKVLRQAGIDPLVVVSGLDEDAVMASLDADAGPAEITAALADAKADRVAACLDSTVSADCVVIGCDSMLYIDGRLCGKPASVDDALRQWQAIGGRSGELYTGHCVIRLRDGATTHRELETTSTTVYFSAPTAGDLRAYIDSGEPLRVAGGFTIDGLGGWFIDRIDGDASNVVGLSLPLLRSLLQRVGLSVSALWGCTG